MRGDERVGDKRGKANGGESRGRRRRRRDVKLKKNETRGDCGGGGE